MEAGAPPHVEPAPATSVAAARPGHGEHAPRWRAVAIGVAIFGVALFAVRLADRPAFSGNEWRLSAYALDALENGRWFSQTDTLGQPSGKPPLLTWLVALAALPTGRVGSFALYWPSALATVATACVLLRVGWTRFGWRAGLLAGVTYLASFAALDQMRTARYDPILGLAVLLAAVAAERAWALGRGWTWFWIAGAVGTLVKGPLAVVLAAGGLLARLWRDRSPVPPLRGTHWLGLAVFVAVVGGWFLAAYLEAGPAMIHKMVFRELLGHAIGTEGPTRGWRLRGVFRQPAVLLIEFAPWSLFTALAAWRVLRRAAADADERRFERFVLVWLVVDTLIFSMAAHRRARLIHPVIPAAALLAGRELALWTRWLRPPLLLRACAALSVAVLALLILHGGIPGRGSRSRAETEAAYALARTLEDAGPGEFPLTYAEPWEPLQVWRNTRRVVIPLEEAADLLRGEEAAFVVIGPSHDVLAQLAARPLTVLYRWPATGSPQIRIVSNRPRLEWPDRTAVAVEGLRVRMQAAHLAHVGGGELVFLAGRDGTVSVTNRTAGDRTVRVRLARPGVPDAISEQRLPPGASWIQRWPPSGGRG